MVCGEYFTGTVKIHEALRRHPMRYILGRILKMINETNPIKGMHVCEGRIFKPMSLDELLSKELKKPTGKLITDLHTLKAPFNEASA